MDWPAGCGFSRPISKAKEKHPGDEVVENSVHGQGKSPWELRKREHESKIKRDSKREETGEKLEQVTLNPNAANSARFFLGARDGVEIGIGMGINASIKISVEAERTISQWYRKKNNSRLSYVSVGVASELRKLGKSEKGNRWHRETRLGPFSPLNSLFSLASVETVRERLLQ